MIRTRRALLANQGNIFRRWDAQIFLGDLKAALLRHVQNVLEILGVAAVGQVTRLEARAKIEQTAWNC